MLELRTLGRTDLKVTSICLGTMTFGEQNTEAEGHAQLDLAVDRGINFLDTAEMYSIPPRAETQGTTERIIGWRRVATATRSSWLRRSAAAAAPTGCGRTATAVVSTRPTSATPSSSR